jgi:putative endonuclease
MAFFVYILASKRNGALYIGMTDDFVKRIWQHRNDVIPGFTQRDGVKMLV